MGRVYFDGELFGFLRDLAAHNDRDWFKANKSRFEASVKGPLLDFIHDFAPKLEAIAPRLVADSRPSGGSMFRIHRDTRFSKDKSPYKTHAAAQFRHQAGKDVHAPGFYLHLEPENVFLGAGIWHPEPKTAQRIREAIVESTPHWKKATHKKSFRDRFELQGESLKRTPKNVEADHPFIADLMRKDFIGVQNLDEATACSPGFLGIVAASCKASSDLMRFLTEAVGLNYD